MTKMITMIGIPLWPFISAVTVGYLIAFQTFMKRKGDITHSLMDVLYMLIMSLACFFTVYGLEVYFK